MLGRQGKAGAAAAGSHTASTGASSRPSLVTRDAGKKTPPASAITWMRDEFLKEDKPV